MLAEGHRPRPCAAGPPDRADCTWNDVLRLHSGAMALQMPEGDGANSDDRNAPQQFGLDQDVSDSTLVVLPTYQEAENISPLIHGLRKALPQATIMVIDDGSPDGTSEIVGDLAESDKRIVLLRRSGKLGLGTAHRLGFEYAVRNGFRTVLTMDADLSHRPADAPRLVARSRQPGVDIAVGSRYVPGGHIEGWPASRRVLSYCANALLRASLGAKVRDCTGAFRAYDVAFVRTLPLDELGNTGYSAIPEQLLVAMQQGGALVEEPITFVERQLGATKLTKRELGNSLLNVVHMYRRRRQAGARARVLPGRAAGSPAREVADSAVLVGARQPDAHTTSSTPAAAAGDRPGTSQT